MPPIDVTEEWLYTINDLVLGAPTPFSDSPTGKEGLLHSDHCPNNDVRKRKKIKGFLNDFNI